MAPGAIVIVRILDLALSIFFTLFSLLWLTFHTLVESCVPAPACRWLQERRSLQSQRTRVPANLHFDQFASESAITAYETMLDAACAGKIIGRES
jgi:hypothetical protein